MNDNDNDNDHDHDHSARTQPGNDNSPSLRSTSCRPNKISNIYNTLSNTHYNTTPKTLLKIAYKNHLLPF